MIYKRLIFLISGIFLFILGFTIIWSDTNGIWHEAKDVRGGIFGSDEQDNTTFYSFLNPVTINSNLTVTGYVGIGTSNPNTKLDVNGEVKIGNSGTSCSSLNEGSIRYNSSSKEMEFCNGTVWAGFGGSSGGSGGGGSGGSSCSPYIEGQTWWAETTNETTQPATCVYGGSATEVYQEEVQYICTNNTPELTGSTRPGTYLNSIGSCDPGCLYEGITRSTGYTYNSYGSCTHQNDLCGQTWCGQTSPIGTRSYTTYQCQSSGSFSNVGSGSTTSGCSAYYCSIGSGCYNE